MHQTVILMHLREHVKCIQKLIPLLHLWQRESIQSCKGRCHDFRKYTRLNQMSCEAAVGFCVLRVAIGSVLATCNYLWWTLYKKS